MDKKRLKSQEILKHILLHETLSKKIEEYVFLEFGNDEKKYSQKIRSLTFNLRSNSNFREDVIRNNVDPAKLPHMSPDDIDTSTRNEIHLKIARKRKASALIDAITTQYQNGASPV